MGLTEPWRSFPRQIHICGPTGRCRPRRAGPGQSMKIVGRGARARHRDRSMRVVTLWHTDRERPCADHPRSVPRSSTKNAPEDRAVFDAMTTSGSTQRLLTVLAVHDFSPLRASPTSGHGARRGDPGCVPAPRTVPYDLPRAHRGISSPSQRLMASPLQ